MLSFFKMFIARKLHDKPTNQGLKLYFVIFGKKKKQKKNTPYQLVIEWMAEAALEINAAQCFHLQAALQIRFHCHFKKFAKQTNLKWVKSPPLGLQSLRDTRLRLN